MGCVWSLDLTFMDSPAYFHAVVNAIYTLFSTHEVNERVQMNLKSHDESCDELLCSPPTSRPNISSASAPCRGLAVMENE